MTNGKSCYFCETPETANDSIYVHEMVEGEVVPVRVPVCKTCKDEYEATFPKH